MIAEAKAARGDSLKVIAVVVGTDDDPQDLNGQIEKLMMAGATVFPNTSEAVDYIFNRIPLATVTGKRVELGEGMTAVNAGLETFYDSLKGQGAEAVQVAYL